MQWVFEATFLTLQIAPRKLGCVLDNLQVSTHDCIRVHSVNSPKSTSVPCHALCQQLEDTKPLAAMLLPLIIILLWHLLRVVPVA